MEGGQQSSFHEDADGYGTQGGTHYETLKVSRTANLTEIRASYRAALLALHPDKASSGAGGVLPSVSDGNSSIPSTDVDISRYLRVQEAWNVLRDAESRAVYDSSLARNGEKSRNTRGDACLVIGEEVLLEDMEEGVVETGETKEFWYPCRCSDFFVVGQRELEDAGWQVGEDREGVRTGEGDEGAEILKGSRDGDGDGDGKEDGAEWGRQRRSIVLPCGSCSLHIRVYFWAVCP